MKDTLKARGYRWSDGADGRPKSWWTDIEAHSYDAELKYLRSEIYGREITPVSQQFTACERFRK